MSRSIVKLFSASVCLATLPLAAAVQAAIVEGTDRIGYYNTAQTKHIIYDDDCQNDDPLIVLLSGCSKKKYVEEALEELNLHADHDDDGYSGNSGSNNGYSDNYDDDYDDKHDPVVTVLWLAKTGEEGYSYDTHQKAPEYALIQHEITLGDKALISGFVERLKVHNEKYPEQIAWLTQHLYKLNEHYLRKAINQDKVAIDKVLVYNGKLNACHLTKIQNQIVKDYNINSLWNNPLFTTQLERIVGLHDPLGPHNYDVDAIFDLSDPNCPDHKKLTAQSDIMSIGNAAGLEAGESLSIGHDNSPYEYSDDKPAALKTGWRLKRDWHYNEEGGNGIDSVAVGMNLNYLDVDKTLAGNYLLLIDDNGVDGNTNYANAQSHVAGRTLVDGKVRFTGVPVADAQHVTLILNYLYDDDNDGIPTIIEMIEDSDPSNPNDLPDQDGNGIPNAQDPDADGDGLPNTVEFNGVDPYGDEDQDGIPNYLDASANGTGVAPDCTDSTPDDICDAWGPTLDTDGDGLVDFLDDDDDNDGVLSMYEGNDPNGDDSPADAVDTDKDGTPNYLDNDDDNDNIPTKEEPNDSDQDTLADYLENNNVDTDNNGTPNHLDNDDDGDGKPTQAEVGNNPLIPLDSDNNGTPDYLQNDNNGGGNGGGDNGGGDGNGGGNNGGGNGNGGGNNGGGNGNGGGNNGGGNNGGGDGNGGDVYDPNGDYDQDGLLNSQECPLHPTCIDSDGDGLVNFMDKDDDNDGILTIDEPGDTDGDTVPDHLEPNGADFDQDGQYNHNDNDDDGDDKLTADEVGNDPLYPLDIDNDQIPDYLDPDTTNIAQTDDGTGDSDNDGISDGDECASWPCVDTDFDGIPNHMDSDDDGDGINTIDEPGDTDGDTVPDYLEPNNLNTDGDTKEDGTPMYNHMDPNDDNDDKPTADEAGNPLAPHDVDGDNIPDYLDADTENAGQTLDGSGDSDQDGLSDLFECPTGPCADTDGDAIPNYMDVDDDNDGDNTIKEPGDTDGDTVPDHLEPNNEDTDNDGVPNHEDPNDDGDGIDTAIEVGPNPLDPVDFNDNGVPDYLEADNPTDVDTDGDGLTDSHECPRQPCVDTDGDNAPNFNDADDDNDGTGTADELPPQDSDQDRLPDYLESDVIDTDQDGLTNEQDSDDDNDGRPTADELGPDVLYPLDQDNDQIPDYLDVDSTNDAGTVDGSGDSDQDGFSDIQECSSNPCEDTDGDGLPDYLDADTPDRNLGNNGNGNLVEPIRTNTDTVGGSMGLFFGLGLALMLASRKQLLTKRRTYTTERTTTSGTTLGTNRSKTPMRTPVAGSIAGLVAALTCTNAVGELWQLDNFYDSQKEEKQATQTANASDVMDTQVTDAQNLPDEATEKEKRGASLLQDRRFYVGGAVGITRLNPETDNSGYEVTDKSDGGVKVLGGVQWNEKLFFETSFNLLGSSQVAFNNQTAEIDYQVFSFDALYKLPQFLPEKFSTFGILGLTALDNDSDVAVEKEASVQVKAGVALEYMLQNDWAVRSTVEKFSGDTAFVSAGIVKYIGDQNEAPQEPAFDLAQAPVTPVVPAVVDSDGDGVLDPYDACPGTLPGLEVDDKGCGIFNRSFSNITFELNSTRLTQEARTVIDDLALELKKVPHLLVEVQAHTDNIGTASYNVWLSNKRAEAIIDYLKLHGIPSDRLQPRGFGETNPIASNDTEFGRSENRRAEFRVISDK